MSWNTVFMYWMSAMAVLQVFNVYTDPTWFSWLILFNNTGCALWGYYDYRRERKQNAIYKGEHYEGF